MIIHWLTLFLGLGLGLLPPRLLSKDCRQVEMEDLWNKVLRRSADTVRRRRWWKLPLVWIDPVRGYVVAWLLATSFEVPPGAQASDHLTAAGWATGLSILAIWVQSESRAESIQTVCPTGFLAGMLAAMLPVSVWPAVFLLGVATAVTMQSFFAGFVAAGLSTLALGYVFMGLGPALIGTLAVLSMPVALNWFRRSRLVMSVRY